MAKITDIWFKTDLSLPELAEGLGVIDIYYDMENYWEWITGGFQGFSVDITRTHKVDPQNTPTRVFLLSNEGSMPYEFSQTFVTQLQKLNIDPIYLGRWMYKYGNEFEQKIIRIAKRKT